MTDPIAGEESTEMKNLRIEIAPKESGCMRFTPDQPGSIKCRCGHTLYEHYMCGSPQQSACLVCRKTPTPAPIPEERAGREATEPTIESLTAELKHWEDKPFYTRNIFENDGEMAGKDWSQVTEDDFRGLFEYSDNCKCQGCSEIRYILELRAQLAAQPSVQRDEDGIGWCSSCDKIHEVVRPKCPSCGDWLIFAADDKPEDSAKSFNDGVKAATDYLRGMHNMETLAFLTEKTVLRITAERGSK